MNLRTFRMGSAEYASAYYKITHDDDDFTEAEKEALITVNGDIRGLPLGNMRGHVVPSMMNPTVFDPNGIFFHPSRLN